MMTTELITAIEAMDPVTLGSAAIASTVIILTVAFITLIRYLLQAIGYSKMYRKAGEAGWKAFIPVYNTYNNYKISWNGKMFFLSAALYILLSVLGGAEALAIQLAISAAAIALIVIGLAVILKRK